MSLSSFNEAQKYYDEGKYDIASSLYGQIIKENIDQDQVWYSMYRLAQISLHNNDLSKCKEWVNTSYKLNKNRIENLYLLCKYFREKSCFKEALVYYNLAKDVEVPTKGINIDENIYKYLLKYEMTIISFYTSTNKKEGLNYSVNYLNLLENKYHLENVYHNIVYYLEPICNLSDIHDYNLPDLEGYYFPANPSLIVLPEKKILNIRYLSYKLIPPSGMYWTSESRDGKQILKTENIFYYVDDELKIISEANRMDKILDNLKPIDTIIYGIEDLRLIEKDSKIYYFGSSNEYTPQISIVHGEYDYINKKYINNKVLNSPKHAWCEKNWIPVLIHNEINIIYSWFPLTLAKVDGNDVKIYREIKTPNIFKWIKGSSNLVKVENEFWCVVHSTIESRPRVYLHYIVVLDSNLEIIKYSLPFVFFKTSIEYNIGFMVKDEFLYFTISQFDANPTRLKCHQSNFSFISP